MQLTVDIEGYSGPFDLLCSMVENGKFRVSGIKISQLIRIYGLYLVKSGQTPADTLADFFFMTAGLLVEKTRSLLPNAQNAETVSEIVKPDERVFIESLERYRPYRKIYLWLAEKFASNSPAYRRGIEEVQVDSSKSNEEREIVIDGSGAYVLGKIWKDVEARSREAEKKREVLTEAGAKADWDGFSSDDQKQIEARISEVEAMLSASTSLSLREIAGKNLVVTLLAVLELCRMGKAVIEQDELFADVRVITKN